MKVFLSGIESSEKTIIDDYINNNEQIDYCLTSFYYLRKKDNLKNKLHQFAKEIIVDSGAHSFQKGKKVDWIE